MIPAHIEFAIREAVRLLAASSRNFKSRQVAEARRLREDGTWDLVAEDER